MNRAVIDASVVVNALLPHPARSAALRALAERDLWAPGILDLEVLSALARLEQAGSITRSESRLAFDDLATLPVRRVPPEAVAVRAWGLRDGMRISDAFYLATAEALEAELITADARLARVPGLTVPVVLLPAS